MDLMFRVQDTGIGMDPEMIRRIFRPFEQADDHTRSTFGGTGLGMTITDRIVRLMGGEITVESAPGQGSAFSVYLNLLEAPEEGGKSLPGEIFPSRESGFFWRRITGSTGRWLSRCCRIWERKRTGKGWPEALELFEKSPLFFYDVVLLDVRMPRMGGREAARAIRGLKRGGCKEYADLCPVGGRFSGGPKTFHGERNGWPFRETGGFRRYAGRDRSNVVRGKR